MEWLESFEIAQKRTIELNRYHDVQINLIVKKIDLIDVPIRNHFSVINELVLLKKTEKKYETRTDKFYFPIHEVNYYEGMHKIITVVPDSVFFSFENRELALSLILKSDADKLIKLGYLNFNENQLINFLSKRIINREKLPRKRIVLYFTT